MLRCFKHFIIAVVLCFALCTSYYFVNDTMNVCAEDDYDSYPVRETVLMTEENGSQFNAGVVLLPGEFEAVDKQAILDRVNEIRLEALREGYFIDPETEEPLTEADYIPVKWSGNLEWIAQTRAAELVINAHEYRPYNPDARYENYYTLEYNGTFSDAENRGIVWHRDETDPSRALELWYNGKEATDDTYQYYYMLAHPSVRRIGMGVFAPAGREEAFAVMEFSPYDEGSEDQTGVVGNYNQQVQVAAWSDYTSSVKPQDDFVDFHYGMEQQLKVYAALNSKFSYYSGEALNLRAVPQSWKSSDESVLTVDENGMAFGLKEGTSTVTVTYGSREFSFDVNVTSHVDGRTEELDRVEPTRESEGSYTLKTYCKECGELIRTEVVTIPKLNNESNTDSDEDQYDGKWTFTQNDDWFGWESKLIYNPSENKFVLARVYQVTLPEDGRLQIYMTAAEGTYLYASIYSETDGIVFDQLMEAGKAGEALNFTGTSDIMKAGTYTVTMGYNLSAYPGFSTPTVGEGSFYHKVTYKTLTAGEAEQFAIENEASEFEAVVASLPDIYDLTLDDSDAVEAAAQALEDLSDKAAALVSDETKAKVAAAVEQIRKLREAAESGDNPGGDNPGGDNPGGDNPGGDNPGGDNPGGDNPGGNDDPEDPCASGHTWLDANYYWSDDNSSCTAIKRCKYNLTHILTETVSTAAIVTKPATYTTRGETTYTAAFTNKAFWSQTRTVANIPVLAKKTNPITVKAKTVNVKYKSLKKKTQTIKAAKAFAVSKAQGKVTYKVVTFDKKAKKKINVNSTGKVTIKKGLKKGTYKIKVRITASGGTAYKAGSKTVTLTIRIK